MLTGSELLPHAVANINFQSCSAAPGPKTCPNGKPDDGVCCGDYDCPKVKKNWNYVSQWCYGTGDSTPNYCAPKCPNGKADDGVCCADTDCPKKDGKKQWCYGVGDATPNYCAPMTPMPGAQLALVFTRLAEMCSCLA